MNRLDHNGKVLFECGGCGRQDEGFFRHGQAFKPPQWFQRSDDDGTQLACSRACVEKIADKSGKSGVVLPI